MPIDLWIARASTLDAARKGDGTGGPGLLARMTGRSTSPSVGHDELEHAIRNGPVVPREDGVTWWSLNPANGAPWFSVTWLQSAHGIGRARLSVSYGNPAFWSSFPDAFHFALKLGEVLQANVFEGLDGNRITPRFAASLHEPDDRYTERVEEVWRRARDAVDVGGMVPLEYPLDDVDLVPEFFEFVVKPERPPLTEVVRSCLAARCPDLTIVPIGEGAFFLGDGGFDAPVARLKVSDDQRIRVWPVHGNRPFARSAEVVYTVADGLHARLGGTVAFAGRPLDGPMRSELRRLQGTHVVETWAWFTGRFPGLVG